MSATLPTTHFLIQPASAPPASTGKVPTGQEACISNISPRERRKRLLAGLIQFAVSLVFLGVLFALGADRWWRLVLLLPFWGAASGFFQWRDKT